MSTLDTMTTYADEAKQKVTKTAQQLAQHAGDSWRSGFEQSQQMVRRQPIESVLACFAAGLVGGFCIALVLRGVR